MRTQPENRRLITCWYGSEHRLFWNKPKRGMKMQRENLPEQFPKAVEMDFFQQLPLSQVEFEPGTKKGECNTNSNIHRASAPTYCVHLERPLFWWGRLIGILSR